MSAKGTTSRMRELSLSRVALVRRPILLWARRSGEGEGGGEATAGSGVLVGEGATGAGLGSRIWRSGFIAGRRKKSDRT